VSFFVRVTSAKTFIIRNCKNNYKSSL